jgi:hypothetical protein
MKRFSPSWRNVLNGVVHHEDNLPALGTYCINHPTYDLHEGHGSFTFLLLPMSVRVNYVNAMIHPAAAPKISTNSRQMLYCVQHGSFPYLCYYNHFRLAPIQGFEISMIAVTKHPDQLTSNKSRWHANRITETSGYSMADAYLKYTSR